MDRTRCYNMDCMEGMKEFPEKWFDLALTDPPYNLGIKYNTHNDRMLNYEEWCRDWFCQLNRVSKVIVMSVGVHNLPMWYKIHSPAWQFMWFKGNNMGSGSKYTNIGVFEPFLIWGELKNRLSVDGVYFPIVPQIGVDFHPCPKPLKLIKKLIDVFTIPGDKIIDPFLGSGSSRIAAFDMGFDFTGYELDKDYFEAQELRFKRHKAQLKLFEV